MCNVQMDQHNVITQTPVSRILIKIQANMFMSPTFVIRVTLYDKKYPRDVILSLELSLGTILQS